MAGQQWTTSALGGTLTSVPLSRKLRVAAQPMMVFRSFVDSQEDFGKNTGESLAFKKVGNVANRGRVIAETETVPETNITFTSDTVTAAEYSNSIRYTFRVEQLAMLDIRSAIINALKDDMAITLDTAASLQFTATDLKYIAQGTNTNKSYTLTTDGTKGTSTREFSVWDHKNILDKMKQTYKMPRYSGREYHAIHTTTTIRSLMDDSEWIEAAKYGKPEQLFDGEFGKLYGCRVTEESSAMNGALAGGLGEAIYFGADVCIEITAYPEEIQADLAGDFGRNRGLRWVWYGGYKHTWDFSTEGDARAVHVTATA